MNARATPTSSLLCPGWLRREGLSPKLAFQFDTATEESAALEAGAQGAHYRAGTTLVDLMRQTVERPERLSYFG